MFGDIAFSNVFFQCSSYSSPQSLSLLTASSWPCCTLQVVNVYSLRGTFIFHIPPGITLSLICLSLCRSLCLSLSLAVFVSHSRVSKLSSSCVALTIRRGVELRGALCDSSVRTMTAYRDTAGTDEGQQHHAKPPAWRKSLERV